LNEQNGNGSRVVQSNFGADITVNDIRKLKPMVWLNDEVVNNYVMLLKQRAAEFVNAEVEDGDDDFTHPKCYFQSSFFYNKLSEENTGYNYANVARWTRRGAGKVDVFAMDMVFFPINVSNVRTSATNGIFSFLKVSIAVLHMSMCL
jgi:sentrin-specific protease 1